MMHWTMLTREWLYLYLTTVTAAADVLMQWTVVTTQLAATRAQRSHTMYVAQSAFRFPCHSSRWRRCLHPPWSTKNILELVWSACPTLNTFHYFIFKKNHILKSKLIHWVCELCKMYATNRIVPHFLYWFTHPINLQQRWFNFVLPWGFIISLLFEPDALGRSQNPLAATRGDPHCCQKLCTTVIDGILDIVWIKYVSPSALSVICREYSRNQAPTKVDPWKPKPSWLFLGC